MGSETSSSGWQLDVDAGGASAAADRVHASLLALTDGTASIVGDLPGASDHTALVLSAGAYGSARDGLIRPLPGANWSSLGPVDAAPTWTLDVHDGVVISSAPELRAVRFLSSVRPGVGVLRAERTSSAEWPTPLRAPDAPAELVCTHDYEQRPIEGDAVCAETTSDRAVVSVAAIQQEHDDGERSRLERVVAVRSGRVSRAVEATRAVEDAASVGFDALLGEHVRAWRNRWSHADIEIRGDPDAQLAVRFALFHLLSCAAAGGEAAVGARGLTGLAYAGHVFWDTDVFVLPALAATLPAAARAVLEYRIRRLPAARARAASEGRAGARFPWESADSGFDVTPISATDIEGRVVPILTGSHAVHINSDVAWAATHYVDWTGDAALLQGEGRDLVIATADYLASRVCLDRAGVGHLDGVVGPDEYHDVVDDNSFTNQMARWHLRRAADASTGGAGTTGPGHLRELADALEDGFDPATARHEQFRGFGALDDVRIGDLATVPVAADLLLGRSFVGRSQIIKQPDVLMAHHLLPDESPPGSLVADLEHYLPRTAHGSSLSPAICATLLARADRPDDALVLFDVAARLDLDDLTGTTGGGLHLATMGGLWQAVVWGFAGVRPTRDGLRIDPRLPKRWSSLRVRVVFRGVPLTIDIDHDQVRVDAAGAVPVIVHGDAITAPCRAANDARSR